MPSVVGAVLGRRHETIGVRPRSVIAGRQRWDVGAVLGRPGITELLEAGLRKSPGVEVVRANPVTGRLLVCHDKTLSSEKVGQRIREVVMQVVRRHTMTLVRSSSPEPCVNPVARRYHTAIPFALAGVAVGALTLGRLLRRSPMAQLGGVTLATVVVVRRAWQRSGLSRETLTLPSMSTRHPLLHIVESHKRRFYLASCLSVFGQLLDMAPAMFLGWILLLLTTGTSPLLVGLGLTSATTQLWFLAGVTAFLFAAAAALSYFSGVLWRDLAQSVQHEWRTKTYSHIQRVELRHVEDERTTKLASALTDDINQLGRFFASSANDILQITVGFLVLIPTFMIFAPSVSWIALLPVPIIAWLSFSHHNRTKQDYATNREDGLLLNSQLINNLEASATVKSFGAESYEIDRIDRLSETFRLSNHRVDKRTTSYAQTVRMCTMLSLAGFLLGGGLGVLGGTLSFGVFNGLIGLPNLVLWKLPALGGATDQYQQTVAALGRVLALHRLPVEVDGTGRSLDRASVQGELVLDKVTFAYPGRPPVLHNLSLRIAARQTTGIVGVTGAGKTTIAKLLLRLEDATSGRVLLDGRDIREMRLHDLRNTIGFVAQDAFLFDGTVHDNITYGSFDAGAQRVINAARLTEADSFVTAMPAQYDTMIGERGATLSGGQKQRVSLARAMVKDAPVLILDEATSAVDNETEMAIHRAISDFAKNRTMIIIAHRLSTIRHADLIYVLGRGGMILEQGTHSELLEREGMYASLWRLQIGEVSA